MSRLLVGPFNRVEGDLEVTLDIADGQVSSAHVNAPMYRGFEPMLRGKAAHDALVIVPRICGICSVSQTVAAARALASLSASGAVSASLSASPIQPGAAAPMPVMPANGQHVTNLILATENLADHLTHFYLFFMPDFCRPPYAGRPWFVQAQARFAPHSGSQTRAAIAARARWFTLLGTLAGKWPHTQSIEPGGSARPVDAAERGRLLAKLREFRGFLERELFAAPLAEVAGWRSEAELLAWWAQDPTRGDLRLWLTIAQDSALASLGRGPGRYLSFGAYPQVDASNGAAHALASGVFDESDATLSAVDEQAIREDATHSWLVDAGAALHPSVGLTEPAPDKPGAYTWNKAPRLAGRVIETGAIARQLADGQPLLRDLVARHGGTVYTRVLARLVELARVVAMMEQWLGALAINEPWCQAMPLPEDGLGVGLSEAARGSLGHWVQLRRGRIANYQIVAPTSWNFSPRDAAGTPGALEQALQGAAVLPGESTPVAVQHIVRSFDPCMVCTVH